LVDDDIAASKTADTHGETDRQTDRRTQALFTDAPPSAADQPETINEPETAVDTT